MATNFNFDEVWKERIAASLDGMRFGTVEITVHEGRIVQIERRERVRFDLPGSSRKASPDGKPSGVRATRGTC
jgi:hypothetical protein